MYNLNADQFDTATRYTPSTTEKFAPIRTSDALTALLDSGWEIRSTKTAKARTEERRPFVKHSATLVFKGENQVADFQPQVLLVNSNDGTSAFKLFAGLYRFICANGIVIGQTFEGISIRHIGNTEDIKNRLVEGANHIRQQLPLFASTAASFRSQELSREETYRFNYVAATLRYPTLNSPERIESLAAQFDVVRRVDDRSNDLWTTFNRVQETAIRGGIQNGRRRSRGLSNIGKTVSINRKLWDLCLDTQAGRLNSRYEKAVEGTVIAA